MEVLPRTVDRYELESVLGSGGFATVYRARHIHTRQPVALKLLTRASGIDRWLAEARAAAAVTHRNVVRVLDCGRTGDDVFIVMELVQGPTLADLIAQGPLEPQRAIGIALQLLDGLAAAHAQGIVHRDIKPPNILVMRDVDGSDLPKILDFGVSKQLTQVSGTLDGTAIGTPGYMAPELFGGAKHADARADIYAVAATLYEMLSGKLPFTAHTYEELVVQVATQRPAPLLSSAPYVSAPIASAVDRGLARDREARWPSSEQFASALRGALVGITPPSSHGFEATIDARSVSVPPMSPPVPSLGLMPDPSTLRTAPPPVVSTANRRESTSHNVLSWVIGILALVLIVGTGSAIAVYQIMRPTQLASQQSQPPTQTLTPTQTPTQTPTSTQTPTPTQNIAAAQQTPVANIAPAATLAPPPVAGGVKFIFPAKIVGQARATAIDSLAQRILPQAQRCRPTSGPQSTARVQLFVQGEGTISIAQPTGDNNDEAAAACLAALFKEAATPQTFQPGGGGIATIEAKLDPR